MNEMSIESILREIKSEELLLSCAGPVDLSYNPGGGTGTDTF